MASDTNRLRERAASRGAAAKDCADAIPTPYEFESLALVECARFCAEEAAAFARAAEAIDELRHEVECLTLDLDVERKARERDLQALAHAVEKRDRLLRVVEWVSQGRPVPYLSRGGWILPGPLVSTVPGPLRGPYEQWYAAQGHEMSWPTFVDAVLAAADAVKGDGHV